MGNLYAVIVINKEKKHVFKETVEEAGNGKAMKRTLFIFEDSYGDKGQLTVNYCKPKVFKLVLVFVGLKTLGVIIE